jgi:hypothetical protein
MHKANQLQGFLGSFVPRCIEGFPGVFVAINHQKEKSESKGQFTVTKKHEAGGKFKEFLWSYNIEFEKKTWLSHTQAEKRQGITLKTKKSTGSEAGRKIGVGMITRQRYNEAGEYIGIDTFFDWDTCLVELLCGKPKWDKDKDVTSAAFKKELGLDKSNNAYSCKYLKMENVSARELGAALEHQIQANPDFKKWLYKELWINEKEPFDPKTWRAPSDAKMLVAELRAMYPPPEKQKKTRGAAPADPPEVPE